MLKLTGGLFGLYPGADAQKKKLEMMTMADVIDAHMKWKLSLQDYMDGWPGRVLDPVQARREDQSVVGQWIRQCAAERYSGCCALFTVRATHAQCHVLAGEFIEKLLAGDEVGARELLNSRLFRASHELVHALVDLDREWTGVDCSAAAN
jgi:hypothetical protein